MSSIALLPTTHRRAMLRGFWITISAIGGLMIGALAHLFGSSWAIGTGIFAAVLLLALVFIQEAFVWRLYRGWNRLLVRPFTAIVQHVITRLCYFIIFVAVGRAGSRLPVTASSSQNSFWTERDLQAQTDLGSASVRVGFVPEHGWVRGYCSWARTSGNIWAIALLPFLMILRICSRPQAETAGFNIYTLF
jgi:hypothetical protein